MITVDFVVFTCRLNYTDSLLKQDYNSNFYLQVTFSSNSKFLMVRVTFPLDSKLSEQF